jgi:uncharacterized protein with beta-barrel porin domain
MALIGTFTSGSVLTAAELNQFNNVTFLSGTNAQAITNGVITDVTFGAGTETLDVSNWHSTTTNTARITPTIAGYYLCGGFAVFNRTGASSRFSEFIIKNGVTYAAEATILGGDYPVAVAQNIVYFNGSTDYVTLAMYQTTGGTVNLSRQDFFVALLRTA